MKSEPATGKAILTENTKASGAINRADVASLVLKALASNGLCTRKELTAIDPTQSAAYNSNNLEELVAFQT